jgi:chemotaxis protein CheY-P-specific phosphatase CheC
MNTIDMIEKLKRSSLNENMHYAYPDRLDIYGQAVLKRTNSLEIFKNSDFISSEGFNISFSLTGELHGNIICQFSKADESFESQALFTESMNILLGKFLTDLEKTTGLMNIISSPKILDHTHSFFKGLENHPHHINLKTQYELITISKISKVSIYIFAQRTNSVEV